MRMILGCLLFGLIALCYSAPANVTDKPSTQLHHFEINHPDGIHAIFDLLPKVCKKNGKEYKVGEEFDVGNLRYKCQEFGVYVIAGCRTHTGKPLKLGDIEVIDHVKFHCLAHGTSVYYRETACGKPGEVDCDKVPLPRGYVQAVESEKHETTEKPINHLTHVNGKELPKGWVLVDADMLSFLILLCVPLVFCADNTKMISSSLHEFQLNNSGNVMDALKMLPKECTKNGKKYTAGEDFEVGNLRYKCQNYGVYTIEGCKMKSGQDMKLGETLVKDNVKHQCLNHGTSVFYKETTCGILGQPECDKIPLPKGFEEAMKKNGGANTEAEGKTVVNGVELPKGWKLVDGGSKQITGTNASVITHILMFNPIQTRVKRAEGFKNEGVGSVISVETFMDPTRPQMPMSMLMNGGKDRKKTTTTAATGSNDNKQKIIGTQTVGANLNMVKSGDKHDTGLVDLNERHDQKMREGHQNTKKESIRGSKSSVDWQGKKVIVNGKTIGAGPGTFTFGNKPTR